MTDELLMKSADGAEIEDIMARANLFRTMAAATVTEDDPNTISRAIASMVIAAGAMFGSLIIAGLATDQDKRRVTESMMKNFRQGIEIGKRSANEPIGTGVTRQ